MMRYSIEPTDQIFVKDYGILSFAKKKNNLLQTHLKLLQKSNSKNSRSIWSFDWE